MATPERPCKPVPFLNWKGMRRWSAGRRAPTVCKLFTKANSTSSFTSKLAGLAAMAKLLRQATSSFSSSSSSSSSLCMSASSAAPRAPSPSLPTATLVSPGQAKVPMQRCTSFSNNNSMLVGAMAIANCLRRHSDAIAPTAARVTAPLSRFSIDSAHPYYPTRYLNNDENGIRSKMARLGSCSHEKANIVTMGSPMVAKMKDSCANFVHTATQQTSTLDLLVGNPFLTRLNPAPISSILSHSTNHVFAPSSGLLNASKARDLHLNDRIVFFL